MKINRTKIYYGLFILVLVAGFFLRSYHFSDWMHFELDQSRDSLVISKAYENGAGELPLLGPRASGTYLRLGPAFYYMEYISAVIFGNTPPAMAYSTLFFSFLSLSLFFLFCREYFNWKISLMLLALFSFSLFMIMYSRFPWNPNPLPFFILLFLYSLLRSVDPEEKRKGCWLISSALALSIGTQLHFLAFVSMPFVLMVFLIWKRPKIRFYYWLAAVGIILIFYSPMLVNEMKTGGDNASEFIKAISSKSTKTNSGMARKVVVNSLEHTKNFLVIITGSNPENFLANDGSGGKELSFVEIFNMRKFDSAFFLGLVGILFLAGGVVRLAWLIRKEEDDERKRNFLILNGFWFLLIFFLFIPLSANLSPRFFLLTAFIPFILLGLLLDGSDNLSRKWRLIPVVLFLALLVSNLWAVKDRFSQMAHASTQNVAAGDDPILKESARVTFGQEKEIVRFMEDEAQKNGFPIYYDADPQYRPAFEYLLKSDGIKFDVISKDHIYLKGNYFMVTRTVPEEDFFLGKMTTKLDITGKKNFGTLTVLSITPKPGAITEEEKNFNKPEKKSRSRAPKRYTWKEIFNGNVSDGNADDDESEGGL